MANVSWPFDLAKLTPYLLLYGYMDPAIVVEKAEWADLCTSKRAAASEALTTEMTNVFTRFSCFPHLTPIQRFTLKPTLTQEEHATLVEEFGSVNPVVTYLKKCAYIVVALWGCSIQRRERWTGKASHQRRRAKAKGRGMWTTEVCLF
jgi:hypothetical protein